MTVKIRHAYFQDDPAYGRLLALTGTDAAGGLVRKVLDAEETQALLTLNGLAAEAALCPGAVVELPAPAPWKAVSMGQLAAEDDAEIAAAMAEGLEAVKQLIREAREEATRWAAYKHQRWLLSSLHTAFFERKESRKTAMSRLSDWIEGPVKAWAKGDCSKHEFAPFMDAEEPPYAG